MTSAAAESEQAVNDGRNKAAKAPTSKGVALVAELN